MFIDKKEVLRYLRYRGHDADSATDAVIDECISICDGAAKSLFVYSYFDISRSDGGITVEGTNIVLTGKNIARHLDGCSCCAVMAATIGINIDNLIRRFEQEDIAKAVILDTCASVCIEALCDEISAKIADEQSENGCVTTSRFSPGYGDLPLGLQSGILSALSAGKRIGLTLTRSDIMIPRKSVTAIIGIKPADYIAGGKAGCAAEAGMSGKGKCASCEAVDCEFRSSFKKDSSRKFKA